MLKLLILRVNDEHIQRKPRTFNENLFSVGVVLQVWPSISIFRLKLFFRNLMLRTFHLIYSILSVLLTTPRTTTGAWICSLIFEFKRLTSRHYTIFYRLFSLYIQPRSHMNKLLWVYYQKKQDVFFSVHVN